MQKLALLILSAVLVCAAATACGKQPAGTSVGGSNIRPGVESTQLQFTQPPAGSTIATLATSKGDITVVLYPEYAGWAVDNFKRLAEDGYYNNTTFHRVVADFIIQGGDPTGTGEGGQSCWGTGFPIEVNKVLRHYSGALCMAATGGPHGTNNSQFYIVSTPAGGFSDQDIAALQQQGLPAEAAETYRQAGGAPYLDNTDTVFGQVIAGMDVVDKIAASATDDKDFPKTKIELLSVTVSSYTPPPVTEAPSTAGDGTSLPQANIPGISSAG